MPDGKKRKRIVVEEVNDTKTPELTHASAVPLQETEAKLAASDETKTNENATDSVEEVKPEIAKEEEAAVPPVETQKEAALDSQTIATPEVASETEATTTVTPPVETMPADTVVEEPTPVLINSSSGPNPLFIIIPGIFLLGALLGGIYFYQKGVGTKENVIDMATSTPMETVMTSPTPAASASPSGTLDLSKYAVNIMNGSGIAGEAGRAKALVVGAGFSVSATGNASSYDFTKTVIKAKSDVPAQFITKLSDTLSQNYVVDKPQVLTSGSDKVQVIVGSSKAK